MKVRSLRKEEKYYTAYSGSYLDSKGEEYFLDNPAAATVAALYNLRDEELQFEFLCFAVLKSYISLILGTEKRNEYQPALDRYLKLRDKFESPWNSQAKHLLPDNSLVMHPFTQGGDLDLEKVKNVLDEYGRYEFVLYKHLLYDNPEYSKYSHNLSVLSDRVRTD